MEFPDCVDLEDKDEDSEDCFPRPSQHDQTLQTIDFDPDDE